MSANNGLVLRDASAAVPLAKQDATRAFEPSDIDSAYRLAQLLVASRLLPRGVATPEAAFAIIATGRELGLTAMQSLRSIHVIEGKPTLSADLVAGLCKQRADVCKFFRLVESTDRIATYETHRVGEPTPTKMSFTWEDAQRANVTGKDNWKKYPAAMLRARCITALARAVYPDLTTGIYDADELEREPVYAGKAQVIPSPRITADGEVIEDERPASLEETLSASLETPSWPAWVAKHTEAMKRAAEVSPGALAEAWSHVSADRRKLSPPADAVEQLRVVKDELKQQRIAKQAAEEPVVS